MGNRTLSIWQFLIILTLIFTGCNRNEQTKSETGSNNLSVVRDSTVNVFTLDYNKDGIVFQCPMKEHFNVVSDKPGICPLCKMDLEETNVNEAAKNFNAKYHGKPEEDQEE